MDWIEDDLAIGNLDDALAYDRLREAGIASVLTLNDFPSRPRPGFEWRCEPLRDGPGNTPERFVRKPPKPPHIPTAVWINPPKQTE